MSLYLRQKLPYLRAFWQKTKLKFSLLLLYIRWTLRILHGHGYFKNKKLEKYHLEGKAMDLCKSQELLTSIPFHMKVKQGQRAFLWSQRSLAFTCHWSASLRLQLAQDRSQVTKFSSWSTTNLPITNSTIILLVNEAKRKL